VFNIFGWTTGFYWSYTLLTQAAHSYYCAIAETEETNFY